MVDEVFQVFRKLKLKEALSRLVLIKLHNIYVKQNGKEVRKPLCMSFPIYVFQHAHRVYNCMKGNQVLRFDDPLPRGKSFIIHRKL